jgi:hypothetical protein
MAGMLVYVFRISFFSENDDDSATICLNRLSYLTKHFAMPSLCTIMRQ